MRQTDLRLGHRLRRARIIAVDVNERARALCATNVERAGLTNVRVFAPEDVPAGMTFAAIYSNPPIRIGKAALHDLLRGWLDRLRPGAGTAELVVHKHLGADSLARWLAAEGWPTDRRASSGGYRILHAEARS